MEGRLKLFYERVTNRHLEKNGRRKICRKTERTWWCCDMKEHGTRIQSGKYCLDRSKPVSPTKQASRWMYQLIPFLCLFSAEHHCNCTSALLPHTLLPSLKCQSLSLSVTMDEVGVAEFLLKSTRLGEKLKVHLWAVAPQSSALSGAAKSTSARTCMGVLLQFCCAWPKTATATSAPFGLITADLFLHRQKVTRTHHFNFCLSRKLWSYQMRSAEVTSSHWHTLFSAPCFHHFSVPPPAFEELPLIYLQYFHYIHLITS